MTSWLITEVQVSLNVGLPNILLPKLVFIHFHCSPFSLTKIVNKFVYIFYNDQVLFITVKFCFQLAFRLSSGCHEQMFTQDIRATIREFSIWMAAEAASISKWRDQQEFIQSQYISIMFCYESFPKWRLFSYQWVSLQWKSRILFSYVLFYVRLLMLKHLQEIFLC